MSRVRLFVSKCNAVAYNDVVYQKSAGLYFGALTNVVQLFDLSDGDAVNFVRIAAVLNLTQNTE
jgi:hypothetical protein